MIKEITKQLLSLQEYFRKGNDIVQLTNTMEAIKKTLIQYPSSFNVEKSMVTLSHDEIVKIKNKLITEMESSLNEFSTDMEKIRVENLLSYLYFKLGERNKAAEYNQKVLDYSPDNVIALSNKAWFSLCDRKNMISCQKVCEHLKSLGKDKLHCLVAKAEVAFTYSRLGLRHYEKAVSEFENVIQECRQKTHEETDTASSSIDCNTRDRIPIEHICVWMYGHALCRQRLSNIYNMYDVCEIEKIKENYKLTLDLFSKIIELNECDNECIKRYKARSFIEVGLIAYSVNRTKSVFPRGIAELISEHSPLFMNTTEYFKTALRYFPEDGFVLERSGKYFRYVNDVEQSVHLLIKAIRIKPTSFGYHHLALSLKRLLEYNKGSLAHQLHSLPLEPEEVATQPLNKVINALDMTQSTHKASSNPSNTHFNGPSHMFHGTNQFATMPQGKVNKTTHDTDDRWSAALGANQPDVTSSQCKKIGNDHRNHRVGNYRQNSSSRNRKVEVGNQEQPGNVLGYRKANFHSIQQTNTMEGHTFHYAHVAKSTLKKVNLQSDESEVDKLTETLSQTVVHQRKDNKTNLNPAGASYRPRSSRHNPKAVYKHTNERKLFTPQYNFPRHERTDFTRSTPGYFQTRDAFRPQFPGTKCKAAVKCPRDPKPINYNNNKIVVHTIIAHLDRASEMSSNTVAIYDKAVLYRQIKQHENALEVLEHLMQTKNETCSYVMFANIYEQAAFCIDDILLKTDIDETVKREQMQVDRDIYLKSSIEISCNIVKKVPYLHNCWKSAATLRNILFDNLEIERSKETLRELWFLYNKLNDHLEAIGILKELHHLAENDEEKTEIIEDLIKHQLCLRNFEESVIALCMSKQLRDGQTSVQQSLFTQVYIEAGVDAFRKKHYEKSRMRIREAFKYLGKHKTAPINKAADLDNSDEQFDLFILSNLDDEECGRKLMLLLNSLGLTTTFNADSPAITPGTLEVIGMMDIMNKSNAFAILIDFDINDKQMLHITERIQKIVEGRDYETLVVVITLPDTAEIPLTSTYSTYKRICINVTDDIPENEDSFYENVKSLLISLASVSNDTRK